MNNKLREVVNSISNHKIEFKTFFENEYPILRSHISIINDCIKFSVNKSDATINLVKSFAGFSEYKGWLDENDKIDKTKFIEITESFIDGSSIIDSWETYFLKKMKSIIL